MSIDNSLYRLYTMSIDNTVYRLNTMSIDNSVYRLNTVSIDNPVYRLNTIKFVPVFRQKNVYKNYTKIYQILRYIGWTKMSHRY